MKERSKDNTRSEGILHNQEYVKHLRSISLNTITKKRHASG